MICLKCGEDSATIYYESRTFGEWEKLLVIEDIPIIQCSACGERYLTTEAEQELARLQNTYDEANPLDIQVVKFPTPLS